MLGMGAKRFDFHQSKPHDRTNRNGDRCRRRVWSKRHRRFLGTLLRAALAAVTQSRPPPPRPALGFANLRPAIPASGHVSRQSTEILCTPVNHDVALRLLMTSCLGTGRGFGPRDRRCSILGRAIELKLAVSKRINATAYVGQPHAPIGPDATRLTVFKRGSFRAAAARRERLAPPASSSG